MSTVEKLDFIVGADITGLDGGIKSAIKTCNSLGDAVVKVNKQISSQALAGTSGVFDFAKKINGKDIFGTLKPVSTEAFKKKLNELKVALNGAGVDATKFSGTLQQQFQQALSAFNKIQPAVMKFNIAMDKMKSSAVFTQLTAGLGRTGTELSAIANKATTFYTKWESGIGILKEMSSKLWVVSMGLQQMGVGITMAMAPLGILGGLAIKSAMDIEQSAASIQASAGWYGEAGKVMRNELTQSLKDISMVMPESLANLQEYAYAAAQAGASTVKGITTFAVSMAKLKVTQKDYVGSNKELADLLAKVSLSFGIPFENIDRTASVIARAAMSTVGGLKEMSEGLARASAGAVAFDISFGAVVGMMQTVIPRVGSASRAGTQLAQTFNKMATHFGIAADQMGMSSQEMVDRMNTDMEGLIMEYIGWLNQSGGAVSDINKLTDIWGQDTARVLQTLVENYDELNKNIALSKKEFEEANTLTAAYNITADTMTGTWQRFRNVVTVLLGEIGDSMNKSFGNLLNVLMQIAIAGLATWKSLGEGTKKLIILIGGLAVALGPLILIFAKVFVGPLAGLVTATAFIGKLVISTGLLTRAAIAAGVAESFQAKATKAVGTASTITTGALLKQSYATGAAAGGAGALGRIFGGLGGIFKALLPIIAVVGTALLAIVAIAGAVGTAFHYNIGGVKDKFSGLFSGIKSGMGDASKKIAEKAPFVEIGKNLDGVKDKASEMTKAAGGAGEAMVQIAGTWGNKMVEKYMKSFTDLDMQVLHKTASIANQVFEEQEKLGKISAAQVYALTTSSQALIAKMIKQLREGGKVADGVKNKLTGLIGGARVSSIVKEIKAAIKVDKLQDALDKVESNLEKLQDTTEKTIKKLEKNIDVTEKSFKSEEKKIEDSLTSLQKSISNLQKAFAAEEKPLEDEIKKMKETAENLKDAQETELKPLQDIIDAQKESVDSLKDQLSDTKDANDEYIDVLDDQKSALEKQVKSLNKTVDALKKLRDKEVDAASEMVEYNEMSYDASKRQLEMETSMGHDEFDVSWRLAKARTAAAEDQVTLSENQLARVEKTYDTQIDAQESIVDSLQEQVDAISDTIDNQKEIFDKIEETLDNQLELAQDELDATQNNYDKRNEYWDKQIDVLNNSIDLQQEALDNMKDAHDVILDAMNAQEEVLQTQVDDMKDAHQLILDKLNDEKDALQEKYDAEIAIEEAKVKNAQASLDKAKKAYDKIEAINEELLAMESSRISAEKGPSEGGGGGGMESFDSTELNEYMAKIKEEMDALSNSSESGSGWTSGLIEGINGFYRALESSDALATFGQMLLDIGGNIKGVFVDNPAFQQALGIFQKWGETITNRFVYVWSKAWGVITSIVSAVGGVIWQILQSMWDGVVLIFKSAMEIVMGIFISFAGLITGNWTLLWEGIKLIFQSMWDTIKAIWQLAVGWIFDLALWLYNKLVGGSIFPDLVNGIIKLFNDLWNNTVSIWNSIKTAIYNAAKWIYDQVSEKWNSMKSYVSTKLSEMAAYISEKWNSIKQKISDVSSAILSSVTEKWEEVKAKISDVAGSIWGAIKEKFESLKNDIGDIMGKIGGVVEDAFKDSFNWGKDMVENLVKGIKDAWNRGKDSVGEIVGWIKDKLGFSENKYMPTQTWGQHMIENFTKGITLSIPTLDESLKAVQNSVTGLSQLAIPSDVGIATLDTSALASSGEYAVKSSAKPQQPVSNVTQNSGNTYNVNPGMMIASKGEIREFARLLSKFQKIEASRVI